MRNRKWILIVLLGLILISCLQVGSTNAQDEKQIYLPLILNGIIKKSTSFGVEVSNFDTLPQAVVLNNYYIRYNGLFWSKVQPDNSNQWLWENYTSLDEDLAAASLAGMEVILIIRSTPLWAQKRDDGNFCGPMDEGNIDNFAVFMSEVVKKYSQPPYNINYYEIWNEQDSPPQLVQGHPHTVYGCWGDPYDPTGYFGGGYYGKVLRAVYPKIKQASGGTAKLVIGGLLLPADPGQQFWKSWVHPGTDWIYSDQSKFFEGVLKECQGQECFDFANFHGYSLYGDLGSTGIQLEKNDDFWRDRGGQVEGKLEFIKGLMSKYGYSDLPILLTETGLPLPNLETWNNWDDQQKAIYEAAKADYLVFLYTRNIAKGISGTIWYHFDKYGWNRGGLLDSNNDPLPAFHAYKVLISTLQDAVYLGELSLPSGIIGFEFLENNSRIWVLFSVDGQLKTIDKPAMFNSAYDLFESPITPVNDRIKFNRPIYIEFNP